MADVDIEMVLSLLIVLLAAPMWLLRHVARCKPGYRILPHPADLALETWAPTRQECIAQAARALVASFAKVRRGALSEDVTFAIEPPDDEALLVAVLNEAVSQTEVQGRVPVYVSIEEDTPGTRRRARVLFETVSADDVDLVGAVPKAVSLHELRFTQANGAWRCHVTIDV